MRIAGYSVFLTLLYILTCTQPILAQESETTVVQAIFFYRPTCPHCHDVMENHLPRIKDQFGSQLQLVGIDTSHQVGSKLYDDTVIAMAIPQDRRGVPTLVIGDIVLVGGQEIPEELPALIEEGLASGGISWPAIPGLHDAVPSLPPPAGTQVTDDSSVVAAESEDVVMNDALPSESNTVQEDSLSFTIGWAVMAGMILALIYAVVRLLRAPSGILFDPISAERLHGWSLPLLAAAGLGIASYLAYVEVSQVEAVCGPVGECNIVQSSQYAQIFGIPVAIYGIIFYLAILSLWLLLRLVKSQWVKWLPILLLIITFGGLFFSIYLTALELLVIKAVCAWCLSSAIITTVILLIIVAKVTNQGDKVSQTPEIASQAG